MQLFDVRMKDVKIQPTQYFGLGVSVTESSLSDIKKHVNKAIQEWQHPRSSHSGMILLIRLQGKKVGALRGNKDVILESLKAYAAFPQEWIAKDIVIVYQDRFWLDQRAGQRLASAIVARNRKPLWTYGDVDAIYLSYFEKPRGNSK